MPKPLDEPELIKRFVYHRPEGQKIAAHNDVRRRFVLFAQLLNDELEQVGPCREASLAFTALEEAANWAHAAIARNMPAEPLDRGEVVDSDPAPPSL